MLEHFVRNFPASENRPEALFLLARLLRREAEPEAACGMLLEIVEHWPDAAIHAAASLRLARWHLEDGRAQRAAELAAKLLEFDNLYPGTQAEALLLRARADFRLGEAERGFLGCLRILTLFPDLEDVSRPADELIRKEIVSVEDTAFRERIQERLKGIQGRHET